MGIPFIGSARRARILFFLGACAVSAHAVAEGWQAVGVGDCPGRGVAGTTGPNPDPSKCNASFAGQTAVCWTTSCTYKNVATTSCTSGGNPGRLYTCTAAASASESPSSRAPEATARWQAVGVGDCAGRDVAGSTGQAPDPSKCHLAFAGQTAVCWPTGCTYKSIATRACTGGANPGQMYTCVAAAPAAVSAAPKVKGKHYTVINYAGDRQSAHEFIVDWRTCAIAEVSQEFELGQETISVIACRPGSRLVFKVDLRETGYSMQYDWVVLDGSTVAGSYRDLSTCGPSVARAK